MNILYLLHELREAVGLQIVDSIFIEHAHKKERSKSHLSRTIDTEIARNSHINVILFPLFKSRHWSLLVFVPSLRCYAHFDSFEALEHSEYASLFVRLIDSKAEYHRLTLPQACTQQKYDWECGYFMLMAAYMLIDMKLEHLQNEETLRCYMRRQMKSITQDNVIRFIEKLDVVISDL
jgi:Ulp1 family protease